MEKLSLNDILALLLPGLFAMFCIQLLNWAIPVSLNNRFDEILGFFETNEFLNTTLFLLVSLVLGSVIQGLTGLIIHNKWYNPEKGLYKRTGLIFKNIDIVQRWVFFYNMDCKKIFGYCYDGSDVQDSNEKVREKKILNIQGEYFDYIFYAIMNGDKNEDARTQQNFYFLFRHLFNVCLIAFVSGCILSAYFLCNMGWQQSSSLICITGLIIVFAYAICRPMGIWYRKRVVRVLFCRYYIEKTDKELKS